MEPEPEPAPAVDASVESAPAIDGSLEPAPAVGGEAEEEEELPPDEIYTQLRALCASINAKLGDTQSELHEHKMVKTALEPLEDERRCFRLMGSVLVEKTKGEVLPQILDQMAKLEALVESYGKQLTDAQTRLRAHVAQNEPSDEAAKRADDIDAQIQRRSKGGVLV